MAYNRMFKVGPSDPGDPECLQSQSLLSASTFLYYLVFWAMRCLSCFFKVQLYDIFCFLVFCCWYLVHGGASVFLKWILMASSSAGIAAAKIYWEVPMCQPLCKAPVFFEHIPSSNTFENSEFMDDKKKVWKGYRWPVYIIRTLKSRELNLRLNLMAVKVIFHPGWLLTVSSSKLSFCELGLTVWRGGMLFHLKETRSQLNNILIASISLLGNHLLNLITPWGIGRNTMLTRDVPWCSEAKSFCSSFLSSSSITVHHTWSPRNAPSTLDKRPLCMAQESLQGKPHSNVYNLYKWRVGRCWDPVPFDQFLPWSWSCEWLLCLNGSRWGWDRHSFLTPVSSMLPAIPAGPTYCSPTTN